MALVLSINPFCEPEAESPPSIYQPVWESQHCNKSCISNLSPQEGNTPGLKEEAHYRRATDHTMDHVTLSRVSFFKRKLVEDEEPALSFRSYCRTVSPMLEERAHVLHLSLEKLRFLDDPESFLRRSVLINNLLRRLRNEILLQSDWCFPPGPMSTPHSLQSPATSTSPLPPPALPPCMTPHGPFRKRLRLLRREGAECMPACCCLYAAGHYLQLPLSVYERPVYSNSLPSSSSSATRFPQLLEVEEEEEDSDEEEELDSLCPMMTLCHAEAREQNRTRDGLRPQNHREEKRSEKEREKQRGKADGEKLSRGRISDAMGSRLQSDQIRAQVKGK